LKKSLNIENIGRVKMVYAFCTRKMSAYQFNIGYVCRCHASINFDPEKCVIGLIVKKHYQLFCASAEGDALMNLPCSGLLPSIEVCYLRTWERGESLLFFFKL